MENTPSDLIQTALDLMGQRARVTLQGTRNGGVLTVRATIVGVAGQTNMLLVEAVRVAGGATAPTTSKISFDNIIEISPVTGEKEE
jgi:hypothetical protein